MRDGDVMTLQTIVDAPTISEGKLLQAMIRWTESSKRLTHAYAAKFGQASLKHLNDSVPYPLADQRAEEMLRDLDDPDADHEIKMDGERGSVEVEPNGLVLVQRRGQDWKIRLSSPDDPVDQDSDQLLMMVSDLFAKTTKGIVDGTLSTEQAVSRALTAQVGPGVQD
jgi:ATP-dependent DNA ligase